MSADGFGEHLPAIITATSAAITVLASVAGLGWWMGRQFQAVRDSTATALAAHEKLDQLRQAETMTRFEAMSAEMVRRSEANSERFEKISVTLARMERNGKS